MQKYVLCCFKDILWRKKRCVVTVLPLEGAQTLSNKEYIYVCKSKMPKVNTFLLTKKQWKVIQSSYLDVDLHIVCFCTVQDQKYLTN